MTDFEVAVERLTAWLRDYGPTKNKPFVDDITIVLCVAKEAKSLTSRLAAAEDEIKRLQTTPYNSGDDDGRNHFEIEAAKGGRDGAE